MADDAGAGEILIVDDNPTNGRLLSRAGAPPFHGPSAFVHDSNAGLVGFHRLPGRRGECC